MCHGKAEGVWREEYVTLFLLPKQLGAGGAALCVFKVLSTQTDPQQSRCRSQVCVVFLRGASFNPVLALVGGRILQGDGS